MFCPRCGAQNDVSDITCLRCGTELPKPQLATSEEGPRPTSDLSGTAATGDVASQKPTNAPPPNQTMEYQSPLPPPPPTPDFDQFPGNQGFGGQYGGQGYGNQPPGYGTPGNYRIGSSYQGTPGYSNAPSYGAAPMPGGAVNNYLVWSIVTTLLCCLPAGVVAIIYASQVDGKLRMGDYYGALDASKKAKTWCIVSAALSLGFIAVYFFIIILGAIAGGIR